MSFLGFVVIFSCDLLALAPFNKISENAYSHLHDHNTIELLQPSSPRRDIAAFHCGWCHSHSCILSLVTASFISCLSDKADLRKIEAIVKQHVILSDK